MQIKSTNLLNKFFPLAKDTAKGKNFMSKIETGVATRLTEPCQIVLGKDCYLNSRNSIIEECLKEKDVITVGSNKNCDIRTSNFYNGVEGKHIAISKDNDALILTDLGQNGDTHIISKENIKPFYQGTKNINLGQENIGDCYLLSAIRGLSQTTWGAKLIEEMVQIDKDGNYVVTFKNQQPITIKIDELKGEGKKRSVSGEPSIKAIERAYARLAKDNNINRNTEFLDKGGSPIKALKLMTGLDGNIYTNKNEIEKALNNIATQGMDNYIVTCGTSDIGKYGDFVDTNKKFYKNHAYTIDKIDAKTRTLELINPHNTKKPQIISWEEFKDNFEGLYIAEIKRN